jgi:hypothetical protein
MRKILSSLPFHHAFRALRIASLRVRDREVISLWSIVVKRAMTYSLSM